MNVRLVNEWDALHILAGARDHQRKPLSRILNDL